MSGGGAGRLGHAGVGAPGVGADGTEADSLLRGNYHEEPGENVHGQAAAVRRDIGRHRAPHALRPKCRGQQKLLERDGGLAAAHAAGAAADARRHRREGKGPRRVKRKHLQSWSFGTEQVSTVSAVCAKGIRTGRIEWPRVPCTSVATVVHPSCRCWHQVRCYVRHMHGT